MKRITGRKLQARRLRMWSRDPSCKGCGQLTTWPHGFELDHIVSLEQDGPDTEDNTQVLCSGPDGCHAKKTAKDMGYQVRKAVGPDGWPIE